MIGPKPRRWSHGKQNCSVVDAGASRGRKAKTAFPDPKSEYRVGCGRSRCTQYASPLSVTARCCADRRLRGYYSTVWAWGCNHEGCQHRAGFHTCPWAAMESRPTCFGVVPPTHCERSAGFHTCPRVAMESHPTCFGVVPPHCECRAGFHTYTLPLCACAPGFRGLQLRRTSEVRRNCIAQAARGVQLRKITYI